MKAASGDAVPRFACAAFGTPIEEFPAIARHAEQCGFDLLWLGEHVAAPEPPHTPYPYAVSEASRDPLGTADLSVLADPHDHHHGVDVRLDVQAALEQLPEGQRMALVLVDMHGLSITEAASILNVAEGTIKSRCARGRAAMVPLLGFEAPPVKHTRAPPKEPKASP